MPELPADQRLIVALDVPNNDDASRFVEDLDGVVSFFKVGLELVAAGGASELIERLIRDDKRVFLDLKLPNDIPETVRRATAVATSLGVRFLTLSGSARSSTIEAAVAGRGGAEFPKLLFVPVLSSQNEADLAEISAGTATSLDDYLEQRAAWALAAGCDGLIASGSAIELFRRNQPAGTIIVSPGIRPSGSGQDDHKRAATPAQAVAMGADYLVVGRPIRDAADRAAAARAIIAEIAG